MNLPISSNLVKKVFMLTFESATGLLGGLARYQVLLLVATRFIYEINQKQSVDSLKNKTRSSLDDRVSKHIPHASSMRSEVTFRS